MKRIHPNMARVAQAAMLVFLSVQIGCKTPSGGVANPFLAPDRVPPPATRALMPGQAQPYYPGDPLPVMQSSTAPQEQPTQNGSLAWSSPTGAAVPSSDPRVARSTTTPNEKVAIPTDEGDLRFAGPQPDAPIQVALSNGAPAVAPSITLAAPKHAVAQASFNEAVASELPISTPDVNLVDVEVVSPWRPPQISQSVAAVSTVSPPPRVSIPGGDPIGMGVRLRAVPSPPATPSAPAVPRIRLPGYYAPQPYTNAALPPGTVIYGAPVMQSVGSAPQLVQISPMSLAGMPQAATTQNGFRPRTAMR
ncbi:MAG TPA: hypothetical protein VHK01_20535 [Lacipirellulaceae bacterium]|nr:hypothetical protein [Lacipirellulaceae bacterium]